jgi:hypothetical protein
MNKERRERIGNVITAIENLKVAIEEMAQDEQDYHDNLPENFQTGEKGEKSQAAADFINESFDRLDDAIASLTAATE